MTLAGHDGLERVRAKANDIKKRFGVDVHAVNASTPAKLLEVLVGAEIVFGRAADTDQRDATGKLGQTLLELFAIIVRGGRLPRESAEQLAAKIAFCTRM